MWTTGALELVWSEIPCENHLALIGVMNLVERMPPGYSQRPLAPPLVGCLQEERAQRPERGAPGADAASERLHVQDQVRVQVFHLRGVWLRVRKEDCVWCQGGGQRRQTSLTE